MRNAYIIIGLLISFLSINESQAASRKWYCAADQVRGQAADGNPLYNIVSLNYTCNAVYLTQNLTTPYLPFGALYAQSTVSANDCISKLNVGGRFGFICSEEFLTQRNCFAPKSLIYGGSYRLRTTYGTSLYDQNVKSRVQTVNFACRL